MKTNDLPTRMVLGLSALILPLVMLTLPAQAQPLIEHVPDNAALYIGWRGTEDMGPAYEGSNIQGVVEEAGLVSAIPQLIETMQQAVQAEDVDPQVNMLVNMGGDLWGQLWAKGGAMYLLPPEENGPPVPRLAMMWAGAKDNDKVRGSLEQLAKMINDMEQVPVFLSEAGDALVLSAGFKPGDWDFNSLGKTERFTSAAGRIQSDGALIAYIDMQEWIAQVDTFAQMMQRRAAEWGEEDPFATMWAKLRDVSGLTGVTRLMMTAGIQDKNWHTRVYLEAKAPRRGVLSLVDNKPITVDNLAHVPKSATYLQVFSLEPAKLMDTVRTMTRAADPSITQQMDSALADTNKMLGFDFEKELIRGMGPVWSVYIDPMIAGNSFSSLVMVNELKDPDAVEAALKKLSDRANEEMRKNIDEPLIRIRFHEIQAEGQTIHYLGVPYISPAYMIKGDRLYFSLYPQALEMAAGHKEQPGESILVNPAYQQAVGRFGNKAFTGLSFVNLPETAPDGYGTNLLFMQLITGTSEMFSGKPASMRLPPVGKLMPYVQPAGSMTWVDDNGVHMHSIEPFPGSNILGPAKGMESVMAVSVPVSIGIMLPALGSAREAAMQTQTLSHARQLAVASVAYSTDHDANGAQDIAQLMPYLGQSDLFLAPNSDRIRDLPVGFDGWDQARQQRFIRENSAFVLVPGMKLDELDQAGKTIMLFQRPDDAGQDPIAVAWADGHATLEDNHDKVKAMIEAQTGKTIEALIQRQEQFAE